MRAFWETLLSTGSTVVSFLIALAAGAFGSVIGVGGGVFIIPSLTLFLGIKLKTAIAASIVAVIATSLGGGNVYVRTHVADIRLGILMALATAPSAIAGAFLATHVSSRFLAGVFAVVLAGTAYRMFESIRGGSSQEEDEPEPVDEEGRLRFRGEYLETSTGEIVRYRVARVPTGLALSTIAGLVSGMLGVGGGIVQVPIMHLMMRVPIKVAAATSTYIIGITALAGAFVYYNHRPSYVDPALAVPVTIGVFIGASIGPRILRRVSQNALRITFTVVLAIYTVQMGLRVFGIGGG